MKAQKWRRGMLHLPGSSRTFHLKPFPICTALCRRDPGYNVLIGKDFSVAPSLQTGLCSPRQECTTGPWQPLHLQLSTWHQVIQYTSLATSPILCEGGHWKTTFCLKQETELFVCPVNILSIRNELHLEMTTEKLNDSGPASRLPLTLVWLQGDFCFPLS